MDTLALVLGSHAYFIATGTAFTSPEAGTTGRESKPDEDDPLWSANSLGIIAVDGGSEMEIEEEYRDIMKAMPGRALLYDKILKSSKLSGTLECEEFSPLATQLGFGGLFVESGQFNHLERPAAVTGWLKIQTYNTLNTQILVHDLFVHLTLGAALPLVGDVKPNYAFEVLHSTLNTATLADLVA